MAKYDWAKIEAKYISGTCDSLKSFAEKEGINYDVLRKKASKWQEKKSQNSHKIITKIADKTIERVAKREADRNARHIALLDKILDNAEVIINEELNKSTTQFGKVAKTELIQIDKLESVMKILEKAQKGHRLALGIDKEDKSKDTTDRAQSMKRARERARNGQGAG